MRCVDADVFVLEVGPRRQDRGLFTGVGGVEVSAVDGVEEAVDGGVAGLHESIGPSPSSSE